MKKKIALVTGSSGQDGSYLCELLLKKNYTKLYNAIKIAIFNKPEKHHFNINENNPKINRNMNLTGG